MTSNRKLLEAYAKRSHLWLELGLESSQAQTLTRINRAHTWADFEDAVRRASGANNPLINKRTSLMFQSVTESLAIGNVFSFDELSEVAQKGYQTIIDLCTAAEGNQINTEEVTKLGFNYISVPVDRENLNSDILPAFIQAVDSTPKPIYTRCASGLRAGVMTLLTLAIQQGWTQEQYLERRQNLGLEHKPNCPLATFAQEYFQVQSI